MVVRPDRTCVWGQFTIRVSSRDVVRDRLKDAGIPTSVHYPTPLHCQPAYEGRCRLSGSLGVSENLSERVLSLPMHPYLDFDTQARIVEAISKAVT